MNTHPELRIDVTMQDIQKGQPKTACDCPVALAIKRNPKVVNAIVTYDKITVFIHDQAWYDMEVPEIVGHFLNKFDRYELVEPFSFTLDLTK